jgi:DNA-binding NarL/FixJ family response regulator
MRILLVDDESDVRAAVRQLIELQTTFDVIGEASDGREALDLVEALQPDVVLMDVRLPVLGAIEATRRIKERWPHIHVLAFADDPTHAAELMEAGATGYLVKDAAADRLVYSLGIGNRRRV